MANPTLEELYDSLWSDTESSLFDPPCEAPPVPNPIPPGDGPPVPNPIPPPYRQVFSSAPQAALSVPPVPPPIPYLTYPRNRISINVDSEQINSARPHYVPSDPPTIMVNGNAVDLSPNRDTSIPKAAPPQVLSGPSHDPGTFRGNSISISVKARQINPIGLSNSGISDSPCRKELDTINQDVLTLAPCPVAPPVPTEPSPPERVCIYSASRNAPPVIAPSPDPSLRAAYHVQAEPPRPEGGYYSALRESSPATVVQEDLPRDGIRSPQRAPQNTSPMGSFVDCVPRITPSELAVPRLTQGISVEPSHEACLPRPEASFSHLEERLSRLRPPSHTESCPPRPETSEERISRLKPPPPPLELCPSRSEPSYDQIDYVSQLRDQDVISSPSRVASPGVYANAPESELSPPTLVSRPNPPEVVVLDNPPAPFVSRPCPCPCLHEIQRSGCPVPLVSRSRLYACQGNEATNLAPVAQEVQGSVPLASCSHLYACEKTEGTVPLVSHINPHEADDTNPPIICQGDILSSAKSKPNHSVGLSHPVLSDTRRKKLDIFNRLHSLGIQRDIGLPSIVVVGGQGAGKSSFIGSISGINLPRSSGACTRCPIECRLVRTANSELWQCTITLRFLTDEHGRPLDVARNIAFGNTMNHPNEVEERLRRAQLAILNPSIPPEMLLDDNVQIEHNSNSFSSNIISLEIKSPDVTDLSFYDLPGLIASVSDGGRDEDVENIKELILSYIRQPNCIILLTVTCEVDFETQGAYRLAKKCDPEGIRTIGVLTKPDRIQEGEHCPWFKLLRNEISPLRHGWFCVKQLSTMELQRGYSFEQARRFCKTFFKIAPWDTLDPALYQKCLGTKAVMIKLNELLVSVISERIPEIIQALLRLIRDTKDQIQTLPLSPSPNPVFELAHLINQFCDTLYSSGRVYVDGVDDREGFIPLLENLYEDIRGAQEKFRKAICETAPKFQPYARNAKLKSHLPCELATEVGTGSTAETMYLDDVSAMATRAVTTELPGFYPFHVVQDLITCYTNKWKTPALNLVDDIFHIVIERQMRVLTFYFEKYTSGGLYQVVKDLVCGYMRRRIEILAKHVGSILKFESTAFTLNDPVFLNYKSDRLQKHERIRQAHGNVDKDDFALNIITSVEAYFQVASQRFVDNVPLAVDHMLVRVKKTSLQKVLYKGLDLMGPGALERCAKLMEENTQDSDLRAELEERLERLEAIQTELLDSD